MDAHLDGAVPGRDRPLRDARCSRSAPTAASAATSSSACSTARQTSLEVAILATVGLGPARRADGPARRLLPRLGRHGRLAADRDRHGLPVPALHHRAPRRRPATAERRSPSAFLAPRRLHARADLLGLRLVLSGPHHPRRRPVAAREGVRRGRAHDRRERLADHAVASPPAPRRADHRLLDADLASNIIAEAGLSFLGLGIEQPTASWGNLLAAAPRVLPHPAVADGLAGPLHPDHDASRSTCSATACATHSTRAPASSETEAGTRNLPTYDLTIRVRLRPSRKLVFRNSPVTMRRRSSGASGPSEEEEGVICARSRCSPCLCSSWE